MKLIKRILILIVIILLLIFGTCLYFLLFIKDVHEQILNDQQERLPEEFNSFDGRYYMHVDLNGDVQDAVKYVNVIIYDNAMKQEVFSIKNEFRAFDFHWVTWEYGSNNFWLHSGDLGIFYYEYEGNNVWEKYSLLKENDKYYLVRGFGKAREKQMIRLEDLEEKIPEVCKF